MAVSHHVQHLGQRLSPHAAPSPEFLSGDISDTQLAAHARQASIGSIGLRSAEVEALDGLRDSQIAAAMETLREDLRKVVHYACVDGLRYKEIAQIMDIPIGTVMSRLYRARKQLQAELADLARGARLRPRPAHEGGGLDVVDDHAG